MYPDRGRAAAIPPSRSSPALCRTESCQESCKENDRQQQARVLRQISRPRDLCRNPQSPPRRAARPAGERQSRCGRSADPVGGACLSGRRGARRNRQAFPCRSGSAEAGAEPADRVLERRGLRSRRRRCLHGGGRARRQSIRRQRQFGRRACARHAADAVQAHPRSRPRAAARGQRQSQCADRQRGAGQDHRHRRDRQCRPPHRRALQGPAAHEGDRLRSLSDGGRDRRAGRRRRSSSTI